MTTDDAIPVAAVSADATLPGPPRRVRRRRMTGGQRLGQLVVVAAAVLGLGLTAACGGRLWLVRHGADVRTVVDGVERRPGQNGADYFTIHFHYAAPDDGRRVDDSEEGETSAVYTLKPGDVAGGRFVRVLGRPVCLCLAEDPGRRTDELLCGTALADGLLSMFVVGYAVRRWRARRLVRRGVEVPGVVADHVPLSGGRSTPAGWLVYRYAADDGTVKTATAVVRRSAYDATADGTPITVLVLGRRVGVYEFGDYEAVGLRRTSNTEHPTSNIEKGSQ